MQIVEASAGGVQEHYAPLMRNYCFGRSLIITKAGWMGRGLSSTCQGDTVLVVLGGGVHYTIRPFDKYWNFVGQSYISGFMAGEII